MNKDYKYSELSQELKDMITVSADHVNDEIETVRTQLNKKGEVIRIWVVDYKEQKEHFETAIKKDNEQLAEVAKEEGISVKKVIERRNRNHKANLRRLGANI